jgi:hypothetical protein
MKVIRMLGVVLCVIAATALVGADVAVAAEGTVLCKENEEPCNPENRYLAPTVLEAKLKEATTATFASSVGNINCKSSTLKGETKEEEGESLEGTISSVTYAECKLGETSCTVTAVDLSYAFKDVAVEAGNGTLTELNGGSGSPGESVKCGSLVSCTFSAETKFTFEAGNPGKLKVEKAAVEGKGLLCPKETTFTATYVLQAPAGNIADRWARTALCTSGAAARCSGPNTYGINTAIESALEGTTKAKFEFGAVTTECSVSTLKGKTTSAAAQPLTVEILGLSFGTCSGTCSVSVLSAGPQAALRASAPIGNGELSIANPEFKIECTSPSLTCVYRSPTVVLDVTGGSGPPGASPKIKAVNEQMSKTSGTCAEELKWTATYVVSSVLPLFVTG